MFDISANGIITISRGDSFTLNVAIDIGEPLNSLLYELGNDDKVYFGLMEPNQPFEHALVRKMYTKEDQTSDLDVVMNFVPEDTEFLMPGKYYYMVKLVRSDNSVDTIVSKTKFIIID